MTIRTQQTESEFYVNHNNEDIKNAVEKAVRHLQETSEYSEFIGIRFDRTRLLSVGDECGKSRTNIDRNDTREFPEYGTPEYNSLEELDGTSAYDVECWEPHILDKGEWTEDDIDLHLYVVEGDGIDRESGEDMDEVIIHNAEVMAVIF